MQLVHVLLASTALSFFPGPVQAQAEFWSKQAPIPSAGSILGVHALSATEIWCSTSPYPFSSNGEIAHTSDAGASWELDDLDPGGVTAVFFLDSQHGWTAGGAFRHTTDGGQTWITDNNWGSIADLFFIDAQHGWAAGNGSAAYYTTDGGLSWTGVVTPSGHNLSSIWFTDTLNGWAVPIQGRIVRTTDGGQTWSVNFDAGSAYLSTIQFVSPLEGWAIGGDTFLHTTDGGQSWTLASVPLGTWSHAARFFDSQNGVSVGQAGNIVRTVDGGQTWTTVRAQGSGPGLVDVEYGDAQTVVCSGSGGALLRSTDGGLTWSSIQSGAGGITRDLDIHSAHTAWAANQGGEIVLTTNGGARWERVALAGFSQVTGVDFVDEQSGWAAGWSGSFSANEGLISRSSDGGQTWTLQANYPNVQLDGVLAFDAQTAVAYGAYNGSTAMYRTTDGGQTWSPAGPPQGSFRGACAVDSMTGWFVGTHIYKTTDAGATWSLQHQSSGALMAEISFADPLHGWASGFAAQVLHTIDGGQTWSPQSAGAPAGTGLMGVWAVDADTAWVTGWDGFVARTLDGGQTWQSEVIAGTGAANFECVEFVDAERGWVCGDQGIFLRNPGFLGSETAYCFGDGSSQFCPCGNPGASGAGCANSTSVGAALSAAGSNLVDLDDLGFLAIDLLPGQPALLFSGDNAVQAGNGALFGDGLRCAGGNVKRLGVSLPLADGSATWGPGLAGAGGWGSGDVRRFQVWYRDPVNSPCGAAFNLSNGVEITFAL